MAANLKGVLISVAFLCGLILHTMLAQAEEPSSKVVTVALIDSAIFNKDNQNRLCKNLGGRTVVDKTMLKRFLIIYPEDKAPLALVAWFLASTNKLYELTPAAGLPTAEKFFNDDTYQIVCKKPATAEGDQGSTSAPDPLTQLAKKIVVRKAVSDLTKTADEITVANAATASYAKDKVAHTTTISTEGLVGLVLAGTGADKKPILGRAAVADEDRVFYWYRVTPYIFHKRFDLEPDNKNKKDVNYVTPGIAGNVILVAPDRRTSLSAQLDASTTLDQEQDSRHSIASLRLSPAFVWNDQQILRAPLPLISHLTMYPELVFVGRQFHIEDAGRNAELLKQTSFSSLGFDATAQFFWTDTDSIFSSFVIKTAYVYRDSTGGVADIRRRTGGIAFSPAFSKNITVEFEYVNGRDETTLLLEQRWTAALGVRY